MSNRTRVPAKLHSELSEYSQLLKALRTNRTLDLSYHLSQHASTSSSAGVGLGGIRSGDDVNEHENSDLDEDLDLDLQDGGGDMITQLYSERATSPPMTSDAEGISTRAVSLVNDQQSSSPHTSASAKAKGKDKQKQKQKQKQNTMGEKSVRRKGSNDVWTRWPLLKGDVNEPEWGLEEEVGVVAERVGRLVDEREGVQHAMETGSANDSDEGVESDTTDSDDTQILDSPSSSPQATGNQSTQPHLNPLLTTLATTHLSSLLALLAYHRPLVERSLYPRLRPTDWRDVLACAAASGRVSPRVLERTQRRLEAMYGPYSRPSPANRTSTTLSALHKRSEAHNRAFDEIFTMQGPPPVGSSARSRPRKSKKVKESRGCAVNADSIVRTREEETEGEGRGEGQVIGAEVGQS